MAGKQSSNGGVKWTAMSTVIAALVAAAAAIVVGYWQYAQKNEGVREFRGRVIDAKTGKVLRQAKIILEASSSPPIVYSDSEGFFSFPLEKVNTQVRIRVEANGYEQYDRFINPASGSGVEEIQIQPTQKTSQPASTSRTGVAIVFNPPLNVRESPNGAILCSVREKTAINIYGSANS